MYCFRILDRRIVLCLLHRRVCYHSQRLDGRDPLLLIELDMHAALLLADIIGQNERLFQLLAIGNLRLLGLWRGLLYTPQSLGFPRSLLPVDVPIIIHHFLLVFACVDLGPQRRLRSLITEVIVHIMLVAADEVDGLDACSIR